MRINLSRVTNDARLQRRVKGLDSDHVQTMAQLLLDDPAFDLPPVSAVSEGNDFHFWDGWHRIEAYRQAKRKDIPATVTKGTWRDAWKASFNANGTHGMPRTKADIEAVLKAAFEDEEISTQSDHEIARLTGLSPQTIGRRRKVLSIPNGIDAPAQRTVTRNGKTYPMNTATIGRTPKPVEDIDEINAQLAAAAHDECEETSEPFVAPQPSLNGKHTSNGKAETNGKHVELDAPKPPKVGQPYFDDRLVEEYLGKLIRLFDSRAAVYGKSQQHTECMDAMEPVVAAWRRWQRVTTSFPSRKG